MEPLFTKARGELPSSMPRNPILLMEGSRLEDCPYYVDDDIKPLRFVNTVLRERNRGCLGRVVYSMQLPLSYDGTTSLTRDVVWRRSDPDVVYGVAMLRTGGTVERWCSFENMRRRYCPEDSTGNHMYVHACYYRTHT